MEKPIIIIADKKGAYADALEEKFVYELGVSAEIQMITEYEYFDSYFAVPRNAEILIVGEEFYSENLHRHNIGQIFVLTEEQDEGISRAVCLYRYDSIQDIYHKITGRSREFLTAKEAEQKTRVIAFYSTAGGCGKTTLSMAAAECLGRQGKKVFYMSTEAVQSFSFYLEQDSGMPREFYKNIGSISEDVYGDLRKFIRKERFDYLPPFKISLEPYRVGSDFWEKLLSSCRQSRDYDYIVVDIESGYDLAGLKLLQEAEKAVLVTGQDRIDAVKMEYLLNNLDLRNRENYLCVCNRYREEQRDACRESGLWRRMPATEYIREYGKEDIRIQELAEEKEIQKIVYSLM